MKILHIAVLLAIIPMTSFADDDVAIVLYPGTDGPFSASVFGKEPLVWAGLDLRRMKCVGKESDFISRASRVAGGSLSAKDALSESGSTEYPGKIIQNANFTDWNESLSDAGVIKMMKKAFNRDEIIFDIESTKKLNLNPRFAPTLSLTDTPNEITLDEMNKMIKDYKLQSTSGTAAVIFVEKFSKLDRYAQMNLVFFDVASRKVLLAVRVKETPGGFGVIDFWRGAFKKHFKDISFNSRLAEWGQKKKVKQP